MKKSLDLLIIVLFLLEINSKFPNISQHIRKPIRKRNKIFFNFTSFCPNGYYKDINGNLRCNHITNKYCTNFYVKFGIKSNLYLILALFILGLIPSILMDLIFYIKIFLAKIFLKQIIIQLILHINQILNYLQVPTLNAIKEN